MEGKKNSVKNYSSCGPKKKKKILNLIFTYNRHLLWYHLVKFQLKHRDHVQSYWSIHRLLCFRRKTNTSNIINLSIFILHNDYLLLWLQSLVEWLPSFRFFARTFMKQNTKNYFRKKKNHLNYVKHGSFLVNIIKRKLLTFTFNS